MRSMSSLTRPTKWRVSGLPSSSCTKALCCWETGQPAQSVCMCHSMQQPQACLAGVLCHMHASRNKVLMQPCCLHWRGQAASVAVIVAVTRCRSRSEEGPLLEDGGLVLQCTLLSLALLHEYISLKKDNDMYNICEGACSTCCAVRCG